MYSYTELLDIIARLRGEGGCPWDKAQTHESLISCLRDECEKEARKLREMKQEPGLQLDKP